MAHAVPGTQCAWQWGLSPAHTRPPGKRLTRAVLNVQVLPEGDSGTRGVGLSPAYRALKVDGGDRSTLLSGARRTFNLIVGLYLARYFQFPPHRNFTLISDYSGRTQTSLTRHKLMSWPVDLGKMKRLPLTSIGTDALRTYWRLPICSSLLRSRQRA